MAGVLVLPLVPALLSRTRPVNKCQSKSVIFYSFLLHNFTFLLSPSPQFDLFSTLESYFGLLSFSSS